MALHADIVLGGRKARARCRLRLLLAAALALTAVAPSAALAALPSAAARVSLSARGAQLSSPSWGGSLSRYGARVAFVTADPGVGAGASSGLNDVYVRDAAGVVHRASTAADGGAADGVSANPVLSADGRTVVFQSLADDLVAADANGCSDVFVRDVDAGVTRRVSVSAGGGDADAASYAPSVSGDGRYVAFASAASDLVGDSTGTHVQVYVRDLVANETTRASVAAGGGETDGDASYPVISADGRYVAYESTASDVVPGVTGGPWRAYVYDRSSRHTTCASVGTGGAVSDGDAHELSLSADGRFLAFTSAADDLVPGDTNGLGDVFVRDVVAGTTTRASVSSTGIEGDLASFRPLISPDGRYVVFTSDATRLVAGDADQVSDVFVRDLLTSTTTRLSGAGANGDSVATAISPDGRIVAFGSDASGLVAGDTNGVADVFTIEAFPRTVERIGGADRFATAVGVSQRAFSHADTVIVATGRNWPDALAASALAGAEHAPILLCDPRSVPPVVAAEIARLHPAHAIIVGGEKAVSADVATALGGLGLTVERLGGADRYATAALVAARAVASSGGAFDGRVIVATGGGYADALSAAPLAAAHVVPVVLARPGSASIVLPAGTKRAMVVGSDRAVTAETFQALATRLGAANVSRVQGADRYATSAAVAEESARQGLTWDGVALTTGADYPDALAGGAASGTLGSVMLLTRPGALPAEVGAGLHVERSVIATVRVFGRDGAVSETVVTQARTALGE
jgi:putative cell wall-binding protein/Tol biopolymer transport system component